MKNDNNDHFVEDHSEFSDESLQRIHSQLMREQAEPSEQMHPVPLLVMLICGLLLFWGGFYLSKYSGQFRGDVYNTDWLPGSGKQVAEKPFDPIAHGKKLFAKQCQQCHQADGQGLPGVYPPLANSPWLTSNDERPVKILLLGLQGPITVNGNKFDGNMPTVGYWKDRDIAAVISWERKQWGNDAPEITEEFVAKIRKELGDRQKPWTAAELEAAHPV